MKKGFAFIFIVIILISACSPSIPPTPSESAPTVAVSQVLLTATASEIPLTPTFAPTPTLSLPVSQYTPIPSSSTKITAENVKDLQEIARYYGEINYFAKVTKDNKFLFILDPDGLTKYDYSSMEKLDYISLANQVSDFQISNDGTWQLIDNNWLLDLRNDQEPNLYVLSEKIELLNFPTTYSLSPDGSMIAIAQSKCPNTCEYVFRIVSTGDWKDLYTTSGLTSRNLSTFSSDGKYFAVADLLTVETSGGGTEPAGGTVGVWNTSDFTKVSSFPVEFPFYVTDIAFSEDNGLLAVAQSGSIDVVDVLSGESKATITDLCRSSDRKVIFAPSSIVRVLEHSDCDSGEWTISGNIARLSNDNVPDLSSITIYENGSFNSIPFIYPTIPALRTYRDQYYFKFLNNDVLSYKNFDLETLDSYSCDLSLANSSLDCQSHAPVYNSGKSIILATDGKYYGYTAGSGRVDIYPLENQSQISYSVPFLDNSFELLALDTINNIIVFNGAGQVIIQDLENYGVLEKWVGETFISSIALSEDSKYAAVCRTIGYYTSAQSKDRLVIFDLLEKRTIYNTEFNCNGTALGLSSDGSKLAAEYPFFPEPTRVISRVMILNTIPPYEKKYIDFDSRSYSVTFSPDGSILAVDCSNSEICFLDPFDGREIIRFKAHSGITNLAFSPDGSLLATSSNSGLISLWAVPPFTSNVRQTQSSPISSYTPPGPSWNFDESGNLEGWENWGELDSVDVQNGYLSAKTVGSDPQIYSSEGLGIDSNKFSRIEIRMRVSVGDSAQLFFRNENNDMSENKSIIFPIESGAEFKTYVLDMSKISSWKNIIAQLRLDPTSDVVGATIEIDYIHLLP